MSVKILCLALALGAVCILARPIERRQIPTVYIYSLQTGSIVHVHEDGNISASAFHAPEGADPGMFFLRHDGGISSGGKVRHNISLHSVDHNGSYLHFVQVVPVSGNETELELSGNGSLNASLNVTDDFVNKTVDLPVEEVEAVPVLMLVLGDISEEEEGIIRHHMWTEEKVEAFGDFYRYSVTLHDGKVCYLAFEWDGRPVENPCSLEAAELLNKAVFSAPPVY